jgi:two-component system sensor histidine kinase CpxA
VLLLGIAFWAPFAWGITRYLRRLTAVADSIASGRFHVTIPRRRNDELGNLGRTLESMAARLDHLVSGQKRFLGDAAHELCAPLARIRTGLGILDAKLSGNTSASLASIEADTAELAALVNEILAFSRSGTRPASLHPVVLETLIRDVIAREAPDIEIATSIPPGLTLTTDPVLLGRAIGNLLRNAAAHAGPNAKVTIHAAACEESISITVADNGPGVPAAELPRIFEPFHRLDPSRSRDTGGSGLGLAIVRTAIETCGGETFASLPAGGGLAVTLRLPLVPLRPEHGRLESSQPPLHMQR